RRFSGAYGKGGGPSKRKWFVLGVPQLPEGVQGQASTCGVTLFATLDQQGLFVARDRTDA
ncbi:hypothetical protein ACNREE_11800, partial [Ralstonia pseudosolanacearum]|uniref:hypothetical protein n=1 Tax=Ralstonia pseudosolanacearum TaxID=1310165 RepID=UPI003AAFE2D0